MPSRSYKALKGLIMLLRTCRRLLIKPIRALIIPLVALVGKYGKPKEPKGPSRPSRVPQGSPIGF